MKEKTQISHSSGPYPVLPGTGFSLIELLIALAVLIAVLAMAPAFFSKGVSSAEFKSSARQIAAGLRSAQAQAISGNSEQLFLLDVENRRFTLGDPAVSATLPEGLQLKLKTAQSEQISETTGGVRFFPDGSSTGGEITLSNDSQALKVAVNWATGRIKIFEPEP